MIKEILANSILKRIIYSFLITLTISFLAGLFFLNFGFNLWVTTSFFFILQVIGFYFYGESVKRKNFYEEAQLELAALAELKKITADVVCPCDKKVESTIALDMSTDNSYICSQCTKRIGVILDVKTVLKTDPLSEDPLKNPILLHNVEEALKDPKHNDRL